MNCQLFSLTERAIIEPISTLCTPPLLASGEIAGWTVTVWEGIRSELMARIVAVFTTFFAAADTLIQLGLGIFKEVCLVSGVSGYNESDVYPHFRKAISFARLTLLGSIIGILSPRALLPDVSPEAPLTEDPVTLLPNGSREIQLLETDAGQEIRVRVGTDFSVKLWYSVTTGLKEWEVVKLPDFIQDLGRNMLPRSYPENWEGRGDDYVFTFKPVESGRGTIIMRQPCYYNPSRIVEREFSIIAE